MGKMTKVDIFSGFLGAGKTTLIKKLIAEAYKGEQVVLIENEFGDIGVDGQFLKDSGVTINEMNSGCICCSLVGDFGRALDQVIEQFSPDRILIEPSGVGKLSDVILAVENLHNDKICLNGFTTVVDAKKCKMYMKNFGEFFNNQIENASAIVLSHTSGLSQEKLDQTVELLRGHNRDAEIVTTEWDELTGKQILETMEKKSGIAAELAKLAREEEARHEHYHDHYEHEHHHDHGEYEHEHEHHHDHGEYEHDHEHHHDHDGHHHDHHECEHHHEHERCEHEHHHHHADEVFQSVGFETSHRFTKGKISEILGRLQNFAEFGQVLRAKGVVESEDGGWIHFDYVPGEPDVRTGAAATTGMICVIGAGLDEGGIREAFGL